MGNRAGAWTRTLWLRGNGRCNTVHSSWRDQKQVILLLPWLLENHVSGDNKTRWNTSTRKCITKGHLTLTKHPDLSTHTSAIVSAFTVARQGINIPINAYLWSWFPSQTISSPLSKTSSVDFFIELPFRRIYLSNYTFSMSSGSIQGRRKGPRQLPRIDLTVSTPPNSGVSDRFPRPPSPSTVHPEKVVDAHVIGDPDLQKWQKEVGGLLESRAHGVVLSSSVDKAEEVPKEWGINVTWNANIDAFVTE